MTAVIAAAGALAAAAVLLRRRQQAAQPPSGDRSGAPLGLRSEARRRIQASGSAHLAPPSWEPAALTALAQWVPEPPRTPAARAAAYVWAAPITAAGLAAGLLTGTRPELRDGILLFRDIGGMPGRVLRARRFAAGALGHVILAVGDPSPALMIHETTHTRQAERFGPFMALVYPALLAVYGYARHPMERAARLAARRHTSQGPVTRSRHSGTS